MIQAEYEVGELARQKVTDPTTGAHAFMIRTKLVQVADRRRTLNLFLTDSEAKGMALGDRMLVTVAKVEAES